MLNTSAFVADEVNALQSGLICHKQTKVVGKVYEEYIYNKFVVETIYLKT